MSKITEAVWKLAQPVAERCGCELWDVEYVTEAGRRFLRVYIDKAEGVSIDDCEAVSRELDVLLDEADPIPDSYVFVVSSAGAERELNRPSDFARCMGETVEVRLYKSIDGRKSFIGELAGYENGDVTLRLGENEMRFEKAQVAQVRLRII